MASSLVWLGDVVLARVKGAQKGAVQETAEAVVEEAKRRVHVDSGDLQESIRVIQPASGGGFGYAAEVGSNSDHAIYQEIGVQSRPTYGFTPYLRPALDLYAPILAENIKKRF